jgi:putative glutamine amidotransferase
MQALNVSRAGTLIQDIPSQLPKAIKHQQGAPRDRPSHAITLDKTSLLSSLAAAEQVLVNSHHHQAVAKVGRDLVATAWTSDGLIEAVEDSRPERFVLGVQWHPELGWQRDRLSQALFERFIAEAKEYVAVPDVEAETTTVNSTREKTSSASR